MKKLLLASLLTISSTAFSAPQLTEWGKVVHLETGWNEDHMQVVLKDAPYINICSHTDGYHTDSNNEARKMQHSMLLAAYSAGDEVSLAIEGCTIHGRPKIISVRIRK
ncbi:hypothetical protein [Photobacterium sp. OFAV2-7]|uniref:hypothetical protein n=1 Tax=Photobacterium sp. OFAV2-7 TaxID=2917748 RepID=UPI001EF3E665|nr:hypothetical protein [Photobacterium sp. OFAV2-7]MCG7586815.1 hypothetical protein [Photobacterium sp. OFAV2-7]